MIKKFIDRRKRHDEGGFTLIELLVVIVILGILAAVVVFAVGGLNDRGEDSACEIDTRTLQTAQEAYYAQEGSYAATDVLLATEGFLSEDSDLHDITDVVAPAPGVIPYYIRVSDGQCGETAQTPVGYTDPAPYTCRSGANTCANVVDSAHPGNL